METGQEKIATAPSNKRFRVISLFDGAVLGMISFEKQGN
jgi:hypothetical protein